MLVSLVQQIRKFMGVFGLYRHHGQGKPEWHPGRPQIVTPSSPQLKTVKNPTRERCLEDESATHILCDCDAMAYLRFHHLGQFFMEPSDYYDAPINKVLHFIRSVKLIKCYSKGESK
jgi:hypothetical protein